MPLKKEGRGGAGEKIQFNYSNIDCTSDSALCQP